MKDSVLAVMAKKPVVGSTKTRLCPPLTPLQASLLYEALLMDTMALCSKVNEIDLVIAMTPPGSTSYFNEISPQGTALLPVECRDIGECLESVLGHLLNAGYRNVLALNSDGPSLPLEHIKLAVELLENHEVVLGPGEDGGYYLIGLTQMYAELFSDIEWSTPRVFEQTLSRVTDLSINLAQLPHWYDIDTWEDLQRLQDELASLPESSLVHTRHVLTELSL